MGNRFKALLVFAGITMGGMMFVLLFAGTSHAVNILVNPGFETGALPPWFNSNDFCGGCTWSVTSSDSHTGTYSAMVDGNRLLEQDFDPVSTALISEVSLWLRMPDGGIAAVYFEYSDATSEENIVSVSSEWTQFNMTAFLDPGKSLSGVGVYGCECAGSSITFNDDWVVDALVDASVPEPAPWALVALGAVTVGFAHRRKLRLNAAA